MKIVGIIFVVFSAGSVGLQLSASMKKRCRLIQQLINALVILSNEIEYCGTPLPQSYAIVAVSAHGTVERLFSNMAKEMDKRRWLTPLAAMEQELGHEVELQQDAELCETLKTLASGLGKYDRDSQLIALKQAEKQMEELLKQAEHERSIRGRAFEVLGICTGLSIAILLV